MAIEIQPVAARTVAAADRQLNAPSVGARSLASERPGSVASQRPGSGASQRPGSVASQRPGALASQRPGSLASQRPGPGWATGGRAALIARQACAKARRHPALALTLTIGASSSSLPLLLHGGLVEAPEVRATVETMLTLLAFASAWLMDSQFMHTRRLRDLLLATVVAMLGLLTFLVGALPTALQWRSAQLAGSALCGQLLIAATFATAASAPASKLVLGRRQPTAIAALGGAAAVAVAGLAGLFLGGRVLASGAQTFAGPVARATCLALAGAAAALFAFAAAQLLRRPGESRMVARLFAVAVVSLAAASIYQFALPSLQPGSVAAGDVLRMLSVVLMLAAALRQELELRVKQAREAALAERRRVARDLHDGLAQDLAFIAAHSARMASEFGEEHPVVVAARRALALSRGAIADLSDAGAATTGAALEAVAAELRERFEIAVSVDAQVQREPSAEVREQLSRIVREAIANAARHGGAKRVVVVLRVRRDGVALHVTDDGRGIAAPGGTGGSEGFGLRSMRERAASLGGSLTVRDRRGGGTELDIVLP